MTKRISIRVPPDFNIKLYFFFYLSPQLQAKIIIIDQSAHNASWDKVGKGGHFCWLQLEDFVEFVQPSAHRCDVIS